MAEIEPKKPARPPLYAERLRFKSLLFSKAAFEPKANTTYEELACVGFPIRSHKAMSTAWFLCGPLPT